MTKRDVGCRVHAGIRFAKAGQASVQCLHRPSKNLWGFRALHLVKGSGRKHDMRIKAQQIIHANALIAIPRPQALKTLVLHGHERLLDLCVDFGAVLAAFEPGQCLDCFFFCCRITLTKRCQMRAKLGVGKFKPSRRLHHVGIRIVYVVSVRVGHRSLPFERRTSQHKSRRDANRPRSNRR